jgi:hypothetical protein
LYTKKIQQHRELGHEPWVAGGIWTWNRLYAALPFTFTASHACLSACKDNGVRNVFATIWGDDGNECDVMSALPGIAYFAEMAYTPESDVDWSLLSANFAAICGGNLDDWMYASRVDGLPCKENDGPFMMHSGTTERFPVIDTFMVECSTLLTIGLGKPIQMDLMARSLLQLPLWTV